LNSIFLIDGVSPFTLDVVENGLLIFVSRWHKQRCKHRIENQTMCSWGLEFCLYKRFVFRTVKRKKFIREPNNISGLRFDTLIEICSCVLVSSSDEFDKS
jgi:hypothetical protein